MTKTTIISKESYNNKVVAIIRSGQESFEIIIDKLKGITEVWQAQYKKMERGYEQEKFPKLVTTCDTKILSQKYNNPKEMIENYMITGRI